MFIPWKQIAQVATARLLSPMVDQPEKCEAKPSRSEVVTVAERIPDAPFARGVAVRSHLFVGKKNRLEAGFVFSQKPFYFA